jgi:hypothetical protein
MSDPVRDRLDALRLASPSAEARARMFAGVTREARARRRARAAVVASVVTLVLVAVVLGRSAQTVDGTAPPASIVADAPARDVRHLAATETLALATVTVIARDASTVEVRDDGLVLEQGTLSVDGSMQIEGGSCQASIDGRCEVTRFEHSLRFIVEAGAVRLRSPVATCTIVDLEDPTTPEVEEETEEAAPTPRPRPVDPTELAQQSEAYRQALALLGHDDAAALAALRAMQSRWPRGSLAPEVDFQIVRVLVRTGSDADVRAAARTFLRRHPRSARAPEMQRLLDSEGER